MYFIHLYATAVIPSNISTATYVDLTLKIAGIAGALVAAFKAIEEIKQGRKQRQRDYRWNQSNAAKQLIDEMKMDKLAMDATLMLDWQEDEYTDAKEQKFKISQDDVKEALRIKDLNLKLKEKYVRACFDSFLNYFEFMEQFIQNDLFEYNDVIYPMEYYIMTAQEMDILDCLKTYMKEYKFNNSLLFVERVVGKD